MGWVRGNLPHLCTPVFEIVLNEPGYKPTLGDFWKCDYCNTYWEVSSTSGYEGIFTIGYRRYPGLDYLTKETRTAELQEIVEFQRQMREG